MLWHAPKEEHVSRIWMNIMLRSGQEWLAVVQSNWKWRHRIFKAQWSAESEQRLTMITSYCRGRSITSSYTSSLSIPFRAPTLYHYRAAVWKQYRDLCARPLCLPQTSTTLNLVGVIKTERSHTQEPSLSLESAFPLRPRNVVFRERMAAEQQ